MEGVFMVCALLLSGCTGKAEMEEHEQTVLETTQLIEIISTAPESDTGNESGKNKTKNGEAKPVEPVFVNMDWSEYFGGLNGAAVIYDAAKNQYSVYNRELAEERRSPCSTFKIISSLIGLETGIIVPGDSTHTWSGERFWNEKWNKDIAFEDAFRTSCVWYFREVVDEIGRERIQEGVDRLNYGNKDISDWEGKLNNNNNNRALTGFWIESSLKISAVEQARVMEQIFNSDTFYKPETIESLKQVMQVNDYETERPIYGKTGMGKTSGIVVDSWFTGFADCGEDNLYFCVYLGETDGADVSSAKAKEIAVKLITDCR